MKKKMLLFGYLGLVTVAASLQSCSGETFSPYTGGSGGGIDTTWVGDSTGTGGGSGGGDSTTAGTGTGVGIDSTLWTGGGDTTGWTGGGGTPGDSTGGGTPGDSTGFGG